MKRRTKSEALCDIAMSAIPVAGAVYHGRKGHKQGFLEASAIYEPKFRELSNREQQIRKDVFGEEQVFICPQAFDNDFWQKKLEVFVKEHIEGQPGPRELLVKFLQFCIDNFPKRRFAQTLSDMKIILHVIMANAEELATIDREDLELAIDFLSFYREVGMIKQLKDSLVAILPNTNGCNFLVLGRTGAGKSSLLNCLLGGNRFKTGTGAPVTKKGIFESEGELDGIKVRVYDSWGLEAGEVSEWQCMVRNAQEKHDTSHKIEDWFHAVIYCINAGGHRAEDVDKEVIRSLLQDDIYVVVALTKADTCSVEDCEILRKNLCSENSCEKLLPANVIETCSGGATRSGKSEPFGIPELKRAILLNYKKTIMAQVPLRCVYLAEQEVVKFCEATQTWINGCEWKYDENENNVPLREKCDEFVKHLLHVRFPEIIRDELSACARYARNLAAVLQFDDVEEIIPTKLPEMSFWGSVGNVFVKTIKFLNPVGDSDDLQEQKRLNQKLKGFCDGVIAQVKKQKPAIAKKVAEVLK